MNAVFQIYVCVLNAINKKMKQIATRKYRIIPIIKRVTPQYFFLEDRGLHIFGSLRINM
jgi:hypothetical protein